MKIIKIILIPIYLFMLVSYLFIPGVYPNAMTVLNVIFGLLSLTLFVLFSYRVLLTAFESIRRAWRGGNNG